MPVILQTEEYLMPRSLAALWDLLRERPDAKLIAGATDLIPQAREGRKGENHFPVLIDITRVPELNRIERRGEQIWVGATATFGDFLSHPLILDHGRVLSHSGRQVACPPIRTQATIGGNLVNASPAADGTPALLALDAEVHLARVDASGEVIRRQVPLKDFLLGPGLTALGLNEVVLGVAFPALIPGRDGTSFYKVGRRRSLIIAVVSAATVVRLSEDRSRFQQVRLALGSIGPVPIRAEAAEGLLTGRPVSEAAVREAASACVELVNSRSRKQYRRQVVEAFVFRSVMDAVAEVGKAMEVTRVG
jgi:xanthine dehydrogenase FAD-binding subunit